MRTQLATALAGLALASVGVGCWVHYAAGLILAGLGLMFGAFLTTPATPTVKR